MAGCRHCEHECHHGNGGKCHCGCLNCEHDVKDALQKLDLDAEKLNFEGQKLEQKDEMDREKLQSQEDQADLRAEVALRGQRRQDGSK